MTSFKMAAAIALVFAGTAASAKEKTDPRVQTLLGCAAQTDTQRRLQCYDSAVAGLRQAIAAGQLITEGESRKPFAMEGVIRNTGPFGFNRFWVEMNTRDRWELITTDSDDPGPRRGAKAKIARGAMGAYWFREEKGARDRRAKYLGRN